MKFAIFVIVGLIISLSAAFWIAGRINADPAGTSIGSTPHYLTGSERKVRLIDEPTVSRGQDPAYAQLESGTIPDGVRLLTVLTDEDCTPDKDGVSHCLNRVQFDTADGRQEAALRHNHPMAEEACFSPGETLVIVR